MKQAGNFLSKFEKITAPHDALKRAVIGSVRDIVGAVLEKKHITIRSGTAYIESSSVIKNKIRIDRSKILSNLYERIPSAVKSVRDIR